METVKNWNNSNNNMAQQNAHKPNPEAVAAELRNMSPVIPVPDDEFLIVTTEVKPQPMKVLGVPMTKKTGIIAGAGAAILTGAGILLYKFFKKKPAEEQPATEAPTTPAKEGK